MARSKGPRPRKLADVRFYIDADILGLAHVLARLRNDVTYPGDEGAVIHKRQRPPCPITDPSTTDTVWLPRVAAERWLIISRDHNIRENPGERRSVREHGARMVALSGDHAGSTWGQLEVVMRRWDRIEDLLEADGPFIYLASRTVWRPLDLNDDEGPRPSRPRAQRQPRDSEAAGLWPAGQPGPPEEGTDRGSA